MGSDGIEEHSTQCTRCSHTISVLRALGPIAAVFLLAPTGTRLDDIQPYLIQRIDGVIPR